MDARDGEQTEQGRARQRSGLMKANGVGAVAQEAIEGWMVKSLEEFADYPTGEGIAATPSPTPDVPKWSSGEEEVIFHDNQLSTAR